MKSMTIKLRVMIKIPYSLAKNLKLFRKDDDDKINYCQKTYII